MAQNQAPGGYQPLTFATMQKQGIARPPSPSYQAPQPQQPPQIAKETPQQQPVLKGPETRSEGMPWQNNGMTATGGPQQMGPGMAQNPGMQQGPGAQPIGQGAWGGGMQQGPGPQQMGGGMFGQQPQQQPQNSWGNTGQTLQHQWQQSQGQQPAPFQPGSNPFSSGINSQLYQTLSQTLQNPSAYNSDVVQGTYNSLNNKLSQGFDYQRNQLNAEMARRGIDASTITGQKYSDLGTEQARAQADLAQGLLDRQAQTYGQDRASALSQALGFGGQMFGQDQSTYQTNLGAQQQGFNQEQQRLNNYLGFGQQEFNNNMDVNRFNADQNSQMQQFLLQLMGGLG